MKYRLKKLIALLMALLMTLSMSPISAFADGEDEGTVVVPSEGQGLMQKRKALLSTLPSINL